jgi:two-component system nitrogen regulation sensor histidine kinase NtrY
LAQALSNIVKNGVEAIVQRVDAVDPDISMTLTAEVDGTVTISVADAGIGLPLERDRIIEPYMTTRPGGTGLGLAIVKKIIEEHMGTINFADREGGGTVVTIRIDPAILAAAIARQAHAALPAADQLPSALTRHKEN